MKGDGTEIEGGRAFFAPFVWNGIDGFVHFAKDGLFFWGEEDVGAVVFCEVGGEHSSAGYFEASPVEMGDLFRARKGEGELGK